MQGSQDDKTVVGFLNTDAGLEAQPTDYYKEAAWAAYQALWDRKAYPGLYKTPAQEQEEEKEDCRIVKWMKRFTRLEPDGKVGDEKCEDKDHEGSDVLQ